MTIDNHIESFAGLAVREYSSTEGIFAPEEFACRLSIDYDAFDNGDTFEGLFATFAADPACPDVTALVIGDWGGAGQGEDASIVVEALVSARVRLPKLRALFLGEIIMEESEISWITQSDVSAIFEAFPKLEELWLRGGNGLSLGRPRHSNLRKLVIETGGMPSDLLREVTSAALPQLEHLELWLGDDGYGNDIATDDLRPILSKDLFPRLKYLGLRDDCKADETARLLAQVGIPPGVKTLDLSQGTLGDEGAQALLGAAWAKSLQKLDIHWHYVSPKVVQQLQRLIPEVDASNPQQADNSDVDSRYVAVSE